MTLSEAVHSFDGKHVGELKAATASFSHKEAHRLAELCESGVASHRVAATWIVKALCDEGRLQPTDMKRYFDTLDAEPWEAALHLLQTVRFAPQAAVAQTGRIEELLLHPRTLVRVWALDALVRIAIETKDGVGKAQEHVEAALDDPRPSVRARARKLAVLMGL